MVNDGPLMVIFRARKIRHGFWVYFWVIPVLGMDKVRFAVGTMRYPHLYGADLGHPAGQRLSAMRPKVVSSNRCIFFAAPETAVWTSAESSVTVRD